MPSCGPPPGNSCTHRQSQRWLGSFSELGLTYESIAAGWLHFRAEFLAGPIYNSPSALPRPDGLSPLGRRVVIGRFYFPGAAAPALVWVVLGWGYRWTLGSLLLHWRWHLVDLGLSRGSSGLRLRLFQALVIGHHLFQLFRRHIIDMLVFAKVTQNLLFIIYDHSRNYRRGRNAQVEVWEPLARFCLMGA